MATIISDRELVTVTSAGFRNALGCFATGVTVITVNQEGQVHGMTANAFTSVSLKPPLMLACINRHNRTHEYLQAKQRFGVNILAENQRPISEYYALPGVERMQKPGVQAEFFLTERGTPVLGGALSFLECRLREMYLAGDHTLFVAEVEGVISGQGEPLLYFRGNYRNIGAAEAKENERETSIGETGNSGS